ncbi:hypothetical protein Sa4125_30450 [Aureimonas sp. SA4125]|uniref:Eco29kI family restriction endonuclease n=1 Tax=Aureimonas sp. SA4125 TaxID=2826993 RepID=UPI001CC7D77E|nr:Eco29kI family restriction endonuclease [Aureimonas sp. SA4125]BDA85503.1 hypothetical protein Sa4125_30450 [Aureimonas sp. SA4125]
MPEGYAEFELDIAAIMKSSLPAYFAALDPVPLLPANINQIPAQAQGAYMLYLNGTVIYIGKTDAKAGFRYRLNRHAKNVQHRKSLDPAEVSFKAVRVFVFNMFDLEDMLIDQFIETTGMRPFWNTSGFGSNDPGHNRENQESAVFDLRHPVQIDRDITAITPGAQEILQVFLRLKDMLPYTLRYEADGPGKQAWRKGHADMRGSQVTIAVGPQTTRSILQACLDAMGHEWQATVLPNRVIVYKENTTYPEQVEVLRGNP